MTDYRLVWSATGDVVGYLHKIVNVVSGSDLTFFYDSFGKVIMETNTTNVSFVAID